MVNFDIKKSGWGYENDCFRKGTEEKENINYYYPSHEEDCPILFSYSKKIINQDIVKGTDSFKIVPVLRESGLKFLGDTGSNHDFKIYWEGFTDEIKKLFNIEKFTVEIEDIWSESTVFKKSYTEESGNDTFLLNRDFVMPNPNKSSFFNMYVTPDININKVYEIVDFEIYDCNWID